MWNLSAWPLDQHLPALVTETARYPLLRGFSKYCFSVFVSVSFYQKHLLLLFLLIDISLIFFTGKLKFTLTHSPSEIHCFLCYVPVAFCCLSSVI